MNEPPIFSISTAALRQALAPIPIPAAVSYQEPETPFRVELILGDWQIPDHPLSPVVRITIASGVLHDTDKGAFPLDGLHLSVAFAGSGVEPVEVLNPGSLSELQQAVLLAAVVTALTDSGAAGVLLQIVSVEDSSQTIGLLARHPNYRAHATLILENRGQPHASTIRTSAGTLCVTDPPKICQLEWIALTGALQSA